MSQLRSFPYWIRVAAPYVFERKVIKIIKVWSKSDKTICQHQKLTQSDPLRVGDITIRIRPRISTIRVATLPVPEWQPGRSTWRRTGHGREHRQLELQRNTAEPRRMLQQLGRATSGSTEQIVAMWLVCHNPWLSMSIVCWYLVGMFICLFDLICV